MSGEKPTPEENLRADIDKLKSPERYKGISEDIASLQQAADIIERLKADVVNDGGLEAWKKLKHAYNSLEQQVKAKLEEGKNQE